MKNLNVKLELNINGAMVFPTQAQFAQIERFISQVIFSEKVKEQPEARTTRRYSKRTHRYPWGEAEEAMLVKLKNLGYSQRGIALELNKEFGNARTAVGVNVRLSRLRRKPKIGVFDAIPGMGEQNA